MAIAAAAVLFLLKELSAPMTANSTLCCANKAGIRLAFLCVLKTAAAAPTQPHTRNAVRHSLCLQHSRNVPADLVMMLCHQPSNGCRVATAPAAPPSYPRCIAVAAPLALQCSLNDCQYRHQCSCWSQNMPGCK